MYTLVVKGIFWIMETKKSMKYTQRMMNSLEVFKNKYDEKLSHNLYKNSRISNMP